MSGDDWERIKAIATHVRDTSVATLDEAFAKEDVMKAQAPEAPEELSATMKLVRDIEVEMVGVFSEILSTTDVEEIEKLMMRLEGKVHERALGIRFEQARRSLRQEEWRFRSADGCLVRMSPGPRRM